MNINQVVIPGGETLAAALRRCDDNCLGLVVAVDEAGRFAGTLDVDAIAAALGRGDGLTGRIDRLADKAARTLPGDADEATLAKAANGAIVPLLDSDRRPVGLASAGAKRRIPVAEPVLSGNESRYVNECLETNWISSQGAFVRRFESDFAQRIGAAHALAVSNGTVALHLALLALGVGAGHEVIVPDLTFAATINAAFYAGATPIIVDVDRTTWNIDPAAIEAAITPRTKAIIPVHLYGQPADMDAILAIARRHNLVVIEDAAEAVGARYKDRACGAIGDAGTFSFFSNKTVTTGEGGMVVFRDAAAADHARRLRDHGMDPKKRYWHLEVGYNYRLTNLQAAIGCAQLEQLDGFLDRKIAIAARYTARLGRIPHMTVPAKLPGLKNSYWAYSIIPDMARLGISRDALADRLEKARIETRPLFYPLHVMPPYKPHAGNRAFANTDWLSENGISLPSAVSLSDAEIDYICGVIERLQTTRRLVREHRIA